MKIKSLLSISVFIFSFALADELTTSSLDIDGMSCEECAKSITAVLEETIGVQDAKLNFDNKHIDFTFDPEVVEVNYIKSQIGSLGFSPVTCSCSSAVKAGRAATKALAIIGFLSILIFSSRKVLQYNFLRRK